ncbi:hypothetical protein LAZ40_02345 [Cereibacter sphaeroides]|uniref:hypothetical protein n=1 Tax=Cereibacter sphaeroides TaxID=1063 RepID=UPI001F2E8CD1|nr:hypothetical protein [Cereibacter sphaeroides]MCE6957898.1 hypothetical protein [Cereibacter sphaeroides]MCE6971754.1 hypothetical protein [Cereibacter sphaeroides]
MDTDETEHEREPAYRICDRTGHLLFDRCDVTIDLGESALSIAWSADPHYPCLHKHGAPEGVEAFLTAASRIDPDMRSITIPLDVIVHPEAGPKVLEEVNACLAITGRVGKIEERLAAIMEEAGLVAEAPAP